jgi:hypothetical protein
MSQPPVGIPPPALSAICILVCSAANDVATAVTPGTSVSTDIVLGSSLLGQIFGDLPQFAQAYAEWKALTPAQADALVLQLEAGFPTFGNAKVVALIPQIGQLLEDAFGVVQSANGVGQAVQAPAAA